MRSTGNEPSDDTASIALIEETAQVEKQIISTGKVKVQTFVDDIEEMVRTSLEETQVEVVRVPVNRVVDRAPSVRTEGDVTVIPVLEEVLIVEKRLMLKEELHIMRKTAVETVEVPITLRKQRATVERLDADSKSSVHQEK